MAHEIGRSIPGMHAGDVVRVNRYLNGRDDVQTVVAIVAEDFIDVAVMHVSDGWLLSPLSFSYIHTHTLSLSLSLSLSRARALWMASPPPLFLVYTHTQTLSLFLSLARALSVSLYVCLSVCLSVCLGATSVCIPYFLMSFF